MAFVPRKTPPLIADFKIPRSEEMDQRIAAAGIGMITYRARYGLYRLQIAREDLGLRSDFLKDLARTARDSCYGSFPMRD